MRGESLAIAVVSTAIALAAGGGGVQAQPNTKHLPAEVVQLGELPAGYTRQSATWLPNSKAPDLSPAIYAAHGRLTGYTVTYIKRAIVGAGAVVSTINAYTGQKGAKWGYGRAAARKTVTYAGSPLVLHPLSGGGGIGDARTAALAHLTGSMKQFDLLLVEWRRGGYVAQVSVVADALSNPDLVFTLARKVDRRLVKG